MGGSSKKATVGYKYYLGMHMILCHGPVDSIRSIRIDDRVAWAGFRDGGRLDINAEGLFGGEDREGGVSGAVDIEMGGPTQGRNDYLQQRLGTDIPAFRGVVGAVARRCYLGMNPYLKPWAFRLQRIFTRTGGAEQWYPDKAAIGNLNSVALYMALDYSGSMDGSRIAALKEAISNTLSNFTAIGGSGSSVDIRVVAFGDSASAIERNNVDGADIEDIIYWVENRSAYGGTDFSVAVGSAPTFFQGKNKPKIMIFITDGQPNAGTLDPAVDTVRSIPDLSVYGINIEDEDTNATSQLDNTPEDGVPVVSGDTSAIQQVIFNAIYAQIDINPAHIIRECLTDEEWGMGYPEADVDDVSFQAAADKLYEEQMGMSLLWDRQMPLEDFISEVTRHIDATLYVDKVTGQFTLKLIRADFDEETLLELDESNIHKVDNYSRVDPGESINSVTVNYWNAETGSTSSVTADDVAMIQVQGVVNNTTVQYPGFTNQNIASRAAARDLQSLSAPLISCDITATRAAAGLNIGDPFKFFYSDYHDGYVVMRVNQIAFGDGRRNRVKITASEDVFSLPTTPIVQEEEDGWEPPGTLPLPPPVQIVEEAPYYEIVQALGQSEVDQLMASDEEVGYLMAAAARPENGINASIWTDSGSGYEEAGPLDFCPTAELAADVTRGDTEWTFTDGQDLDLVEVGTHAQIGQELVRVDAIDSGAGTLTVGRGVLDSVPAVHEAGDLLLFWDDYSAAATTEYVLGESIDGRVLTNAPGGQLPLAQGVEDTVVMNARAVRPYRPANFKVNGILWPTPETEVTYPATLTWAHRNRLQETAGFYLDWTADSVTPEDGTTYRIELYGEDDSGNQTLIEEQDLGLVTTHQVDINTLSPPPGSVFLVIKLYAVRDTWDSFNPAEHKLMLLLPPSGLAVEQGTMFAPESVNADPA